MSAKCIAHDIVAMMNMMMLAGSIIMFIVDFNPLRLYRTSVTCTKFEIRLNSQEVPDAKSEYNDIYT